MTIFNKVTEIFRKIEEINRNCNLNKEIVVMAAVKQRTVSEIYEAFQAGIRYFGENRVQEAEQHISEIDLEFRDKIKYHFIGRLQSNKVKRAVDLFDSIDSVDSLKLANEIDKFSSQIGKIKDVMVEINMGEEQKGGIKIGEIDFFLEKIFALKNISLIGLMAIPPFFEEAEKSRPYFKKMYKLFTDIKKIHPNAAVFKYLSMGMSNDYKVAIEEGANIVRIGTLIFGARR